MTALRIASLKGRVTEVTMREVLSYAALLGIVAVCTVVLVTQYSRELDGYMADDAFISFRYARNLADGSGPVWNVGERVEGYTNFGWVLLLAGGIKLGVDPVAGSRLLGLAATIGTLALIPLLASQFRAAWHMLWWIIVLGAAAALALSPALSIWTFAGLETTGQAFLIVLGATLHLWEDRTDRRPFWSAFAFLGAALVRPDSVVFWGITALFKAGRVLISSPNSESLTRFMVWVGLFLAPFGAYWLWRWIYYGYFFPNTVYLKTDGSVRVLQRGWDYTRSFLVGYWFWLLIPSLVSVARELQARFKPATYILALLVSWLAYVSYSGGDWMPYYRFLVPALPLAYVLMIHSITGLVGLLVRRARITEPMTYVAITVLAGLVVFSSAQAYGRAIGGQGLAGPLAGGVSHDTQKEIGLWFREHAQEDATMANIAAGIVPYFSQVRTIDMLGVNDEHIAHIDKSLGDGPSGHEKQDGAYVVAQLPEIIWLGLGVEPAARDSMDDYLPPKVPQFPILTAVTRNPATWVQYRPVAIPFEGGWLNILLRNDVQLR